MDKVITIRAHGLNKPWRSHSVSEASQDDGLFYSNNIVYDDDDVFTNEVFEPARITAPAPTTPKPGNKSFKYFPRNRLHSSGAITSYSTEKLNQFKRRRVKSNNSSVSSFYPEFVIDAKRQNILTEEGEKVWKVQEKFLNDDLRLYEGALIPLNSPTLASPGLGSAVVMFDESENTSNVVCNDRTELAFKPPLPSPMSTPELARSGYSYLRHNSTPPLVAQQPHLAVLSKYSPALQAKFKKMAQRRQSAPSIVIRGVLGKSNKLSSSFTSSFNNSREDNSLDPISPSDSLPLSLKFGSHGAVLNLAKRTYVMEGRVQLTRGLQTQDRYMFLFTDLLLIAKAKSGSNYKLKSRVRVCEMWTATCLDDVSESTKSPDKSFVIGWPTTNCVATFSSPESKELWLEAFNKRISVEKEKESPKTSMINSVRRDITDSVGRNIRSVTVSHQHTTRDVIRIILSEFKIEASENDYQLWAMSRKEGSAAYPLIGHEFPHSIHMSAIRDAIAINHPLYEQDVTYLRENDVLITSTPVEKFQFVLRLAKQTAKVNNFDQSQRRIMRLKNKTPSAFFSWARKRHLSSRNNDSGSFSMNSSNYDSCGSTTSSPGTPKLFSLPLNQICEEGKIPTPIESMLRILYRKGPNTTGIFRKSAAARTTRLLKEKLNEDLEYCVRDSPVHVLAALLKDFLRNIPDSLLDCNKYDEWTRAIDRKEWEEKLDDIKKMLLQLHPNNRVLFRRICTVLNQIAAKSDYNSMTIFNLSVCIAPSLLWPPSTAGPFTQADSTRKVAEIVQFILEKDDNVFREIIPIDDMTWPCGLEDDSVNSELEDSEEIEDGEDVKVDSDSSSQDEVVEKEQGQADDEQEAVVKVDLEDIDLDHFNRSRQFRKQLQRRKPVNKNDPVVLRRTSSSLDSFDLVEADTEVPSSVTSTSNDSGFTTLSGEDDDVVYSTNSTAPISVSSVTTNGSNVSTSIICSTNTVKLSNIDDVKIAAEELRNLWSPHLMLTNHGEILDEEITPLQETLIFDEEDESRDILSDFEKNASRRFRHSPRYSRRCSAPVSSVSEKAKTPDGATAFLPSNSPISASPPSIEEEGGIDLSEIKELSSDEENKEVASVYEHKDPDTPPIVANYLNELRKAPSKELLCDADVMKTEDSSMSDVSCEITDYSQSDENNNSTSEATKTPVRPNKLGISESNNETCCSTGDEICAKELKKNGLSDVAQLFNSLTPDLPPNYNSTIHKNHTTSCLTPTGGVNYCALSLPRKAHSMREGKDIKGDICPSIAAEVTKDDFNIDARIMSPIQKLTLNLHSIPDFRSKTAKNKASRNYSNSPQSRRRSNKGNQSHIHVVHAPKLKPRFAEPLKFEKNELSSDHNKISVQDRPPTPHVNSNDIETTPGVERLRRRRNRFVNMNSKVTGDGSSLFSFSVPSYGWNSSSKQENCNHPTFSEQSSLNPSETRKVEKSTSLLVDNPTLTISPGLNNKNKPSVKEKINAFNQLISEAKSSSDTPSATYVPLDAMLADFDSKPDSPKLSGRSRRSRNRIKEKEEISKTKDISPPTIHIIPNAHVSDDMLHSLSESFAFGNRKSPRNLTPRGSPSGQRRATAPAVELSHADAAALGAMLERKSWTSGKTKHPDSLKATDPVLSIGLSTGAKQNTFDHKPDELNNSSKLNGNNKVFKTEESYV